MPATDGCSPNTRPSVGSSCRSRRSRNRSSTPSCPPRTRTSTTITVSTRSRSCAPRSPMSGRFRANRRPVGASTITQQVAKNMLLSSEISIERKVKEILLATRIEAALPKDRILELYLNEIYLGSGAYGVAAAALTYFDKSLDELTLGEAAFLAGLPKAPNRYNPARFPQAAKARRDWVLDRMVEDGAATPDAAVQARGRAARAAPPPGGRTGQGPLFRRGGPARAALPLWRKGAVRGRAVGAHQPRRSGCRRPRTRRCAPGSIAYEHRHGGWRGAVARIDPKGDWAAHLAAVPVPPGVATDVGWRLAMVVRSDAGRRGDRLCQRRRPDASRSPRCAGRGRGTRRQLRPASARRRPMSSSRAIVVHGRADEPPDPPRQSRGERRQARRRSTPCARCRRSPAPLVAMDPHTGRVLAISGGFSFETEPVRPRHAGQAAAGLVDQAVRLSDRARPRLHPVDPGRRRPDLAAARPRACRCGRPRTYKQADQVPRADAAARRARAVAQRGDGAGRVDRRDGADRRDRRALRHHGPHAARIFDGARRRRNDLAAAHRRLCDAGQWRQANHADA